MFVVRCRKKKKIDDDLGGTTPLNIILRFPSNLKETKNEDDEFDDIELTAAALSSISGGRGQRRGC